MESFTFFCAGIAPDIPLHAHFPALATKIRRNKPGFDL
jgi:hypothetical protein